MGDDYSMALSSGGKGREIIQGSRLFQISPPKGAIIRGVRLIEGWL